ncbi:MAG: calcium-binding protein [Octadecabacter sp.]
MGPAALLIAMLSSGLLLSMLPDFGGDDAQEDDDTYPENDPVEGELASDQLWDGESADPEVQITEDPEATAQHDVELTPIILTRGDDDYVGTSADEHIIGGKGDDTIVGNGGADRLDGWRGDDEIVSYGDGGRLSGNQGDDYLEAKKTNFGQFHIFGGLGEDTIVMHLDNEAGWGRQGFHVHGGDQADEFRFVGAGTTNAPMISRIEDFDSSQDSIWVDDEEVDLDALPSDMRIVNYLEQQWLVIDNNVMIGLEGVRMPAPAGVPTIMGGEEEMHFHMFPTDLASLQSVEYRH